MQEENWRGNRNENNSGVTIFNLGKTSYILLAVFSGLALGVGVFAVVDAIRAEREARLLEYYVMEVDAKLVKLGIENPDDIWAARKRKSEEHK